MSHHTIPISDVWRMLGGGPIESGQARAWWRDSGERTIVIDHARGTWSDTTDRTGGGVLDLIAAVHGSTRAEADQWLSDELELALWTARVVGCLEVTYA